VCPEPEQLRPALDRAQNELDSRLAEACGQHGSDESTGELIKLEEILTEAALAAKEAISIRRRLGVERDKDASAAQSQAEGSELGPPVGVRDFVDAEGRAWHVWEVPPEQLSARSRPGVYAGEYQSGWLAFETADGEERRRLPRYPREWREIDGQGIESLCREAQPVTRRLRPVQRPGSRAEGEEGDRP